MPLLTSETIQTLQCFQSKYIECYIALWIWKVVPFILFVVGAIGNILSLIVLSSQQFCKKSTCVYLRILAVTDTICLCSGPLLHMMKSTFGINMWSLSTFNCSITGWIVYSSGMISCWIIVLITMERTLLTLLPFAAKPKMTTRNAIFISIFLSVLVILMNSHLIYGSIIVERHVNITVANRTGIRDMRSCTLRPGKYSDFHDRVWNKMLFIIGSVFPLLLISIGNAIVTFSLVKSRKALRRVQHNDGRVVNGMNQSSSILKANYKLFFLLCGVYIITTIPFGVYVSTFPFNKEVDVHTLAKYQLAAVIIRCLIWSNFSFNFFLYVLTGSLFRKELWRLFESANNYFNMLRAGNSVHPQTDQTI